MSVLINLRDHKKLPEAENEIRTYILKHPKEVLSMSIHELAKKTYTSPTSIVRLCKRLDIKGFSQLKIQLSSEIKTFDNLHLEILDIFPFLHIFLLQLYLNIETLITDLQFLFYKIF